MMTSLVAGVAAVARVACAVLSAILAAAPAPPPAGTPYFLHWQIIIPIALCGLLTGIVLRLLPFWRHIDPLTSVGLYTLLPVLLYIGATAIGLSWEEGRSAAAVIHLTIVWPYIGYAGCILAGKYVVEGVRRLRWWRRCRRVARTLANARAGPTVVPTARGDEREKEKEKEKEE